MINKTTESRLRDALTTVANDTSPTLEFNQIVAQLDSEVGPATDHRRNRLLAAAGLLVVAASSFAWLRASNQEAFDLDSTDSTNTSQVQEELPDPTLPFVLPGEVVVSEDPLIVHAADGPEPQFDTSGLGDEVGFLPLVQPQIDQMLERVNVEENTQAGIHRKTVLLGTVDAIPVVVNLVDEAAGDNWNKYGASGPNDIVRRRTVMSSLGGMTERKPITQGSLALIQQPSVEDGNIEPDLFIVPSDGLVLWSQLPAETSVVAFESAAGREWMRPRDGVAVFRSGLDHGETIVLRALNIDGVEISSREAQLDFTQVKATEYEGPELISGRFDEATPPPSHYVLEGEVVLGEDPLIVQAVPGPEPRFDTSNLGIEVTVGTQESCADPSGPYGRWWDSTLEDNPAAIPIKFTVIGHVAGQCWYVGVSDRPFGFGSASKSPDTNVRLRAIGSFGANSLSSGKQADRASLDFIQSPSAGEPGYGTVTSTGTWNGTGFVSDGVPPTVSVAVLQTDGQDYWTRPHAGIILFPVSESSRNPHIILLLDADGNEVRRLGDR